MSIYYVKRDEGVHRDWVTVIYRTTSQSTPAVCFRNLWSAHVECGPHEDQESGIEVHPSEAVARMKARQVGTLTKFLIVEG